MILEAIYSENPIVPICILFIILIIFTFILTIAFYPLLKTAFLIHNLTRNMRWCAVGYNGEEVIAKITRYLDGYGIHYRNVREINSTEGIGGELRTIDELFEKVTSKGMRVRIDVLNLDKHDIRIVILDNKKTEPTYSTRIYIGHVDGELSSLIKSIENDFTELFESKP